MLKNLICAFLCVGCFAISKSGRTEEPTFLEDAENQTHLLDSTPSEPVSKKANLEVQCKLTGYHDYYFNNARVFSAGYWGEYWVNLGCELDFGEAQGTDIGMTHFVELKASKPCLVKVYDKGGFLGWGQGEENAMLSAFFDKKFKVHLTAQAHQSQFAFWVAYLGVQGVDGLSLGDLNSIWEKIAGQGVKPLSAPEVLNHLKPKGSDYLGIWEFFSGQFLREGTLFLAKPYGFQDFESVRVLFRDCQGSFKLQDDKKIELSNQRLDLPRSLFEGHTQ